MPELPEVETVVRGLNRLILKKKILKVKHDWPKSFPNSPKDVEDFMVGAEISKVSRRGKAIILKLNNEYTLVTHLRMTGQMVYRGEENWGAGHPNEDFLNDLLMKAGFIPEEDDFDQLKAELEPLLMDTIMTKVFEALSNEQRDEVMKLFDAGKEAEALEKIETMIPDYDNFLADVFQQF